MFQYSDIFFPYFYLMEYDSKLSIHLAKNSCKIIYLGQNSVLQTSATSKKKIKNGVWIFLEFGAGPQEANHKCEKFFFCFMLCPKLFMWILHSIPYYILACFNKICFKLFTSDKTNIPLLFRMDGSIAFCLLWEIKAVTVTNAVD